MKNNADFNKSITDDWRTPSFIYNKFINLGYLDPCPYKSTINGLNINYKFEKLFINPPYSDISTWVDYAIKQYNNGCDIVLLIPARTDTKYFHKLLKLSPIINFIEGRLKFNDCDKCAPFPSLFIELVHFKKLGNFYTFGNVNDYLKSLF